MKHKSPCPQDYILVGEADNKKISIINKRIIYSMLIDEKCYRGKTELGSAGGSRLQE